MQSMKSKYLHVASIHYFNETLDANILKSGYFSLEIVARPLCYPENSASVRTKAWKNASCPATVHLANSLSTSSFESKDKAENKRASHLSRSLAEREMIHATDFSLPVPPRASNSALLIVKRSEALRPWDFQEYLNVTESACV